MYMDIFGDRRFERCDVVKFKKDGRLAVIIGAYGYLCVSGGGANGLNKGDYCVMFIDDGHSLAWINENKIEYDYSINELELEKICLKFWDIEGETRCYKERRSCN